MTPFRAGRFAAMLAPIALVAACSQDPAPAAVQSGRMDARLAPEIAAGQVAVQPLPNGTQVVIPDEMLFAPGRTQLDPKGTLVLTHVIQALIEPTMVTIGVADASDGLQGGADAIGAGLLPRPRPRPAGRTDGGAACRIGRPRRHAASGHHDHGQRHLGVIPSPYALSARKPPSPRQNRAGAGRRGTR